MWVAERWPANRRTVSVPLPILDATAAMMFSTSYRYRPPSRSVSRAWVSSTMPRKTHIGAPRVMLSDHSIGLDVGLD